MIRAAIVGLGWWGKTLVEAVEGSDVVGFVAGTTRTMTPEVEAFAKAKNSSWRRTTRRCWRIPGIDAVVLATPHSMHAAQVIAAAAAGKHVFCEKPFALTKQQAQDAVAAVRKAGVALGSATIAASIPR